MNVLKKVLVVLLLTLCVLALATGCKNKAKNCDHDWVERNVSEAQISAATCTEPAVYYKSCAKCHTISDSLTFEADAARGHNEVREAIAANLISAADCTHSAVYKAYCSDCSADLGTFTVGEPLGHNYVENADAKYRLYEQSCDKAETYLLSCDRCGEAHESETFITQPALGHIPVQEQHNDHLANALSCEEALTYYESCERCNANLENKFTVGEALGHNFVENATKVNSATQKTCTEPAKYYKSCEHCGLKSNETFYWGDAAGHTFQEIQSKDHLAGNYTCGDTPSYYKVCSECGEYEVDENGEKVTFTGMVLPHILEHKDTVEATKDAHGTAEYYYCTKCPALFTKDGENFVQIQDSNTLLLHNYKWFHTEDGKSHYQACIVEGCDAEHKHEGEHTFDEIGCDVTCNGECGYERESQHVDANNDGICEKCEGDVKAPEVPDGGDLDNLTPWMPL